MKSFDCDCLELMMSTQDHPFLEEPCEPRMVLRIDARSVRRLTALFFSTARWPAESFGKLQTFFSVPFHQGSPGQDFSRGQTRIQTPCD